MMFSMAFEYICTGFVKSILTYAKIGRFATHVTTARDLYSMIINTSLICWLNTETGHLEFQDVSIVKLKHSKASISQLTVELDHDKGEVVRLLIRVDKTEELFEIKELDPRFCTEASAILLLVFSYWTHPHVHYWANGVAQLTKPDDPKLHWKLAKESNNVTQWINLASVHSSILYIGNETIDVTAHTITSALNNGMPMLNQVDENGSEVLMHVLNPNIPLQSLKANPNTTDVLKKKSQYIEILAKKSILHQMHTEISKKIKEMFPGKYQVSQQVLDKNSAKKNLRIAKKLVKVCLHSS